MSRKLTQTILQTRLQSMGLDKLDDQTVPTRPMQLRCLAAGHEFTLPFSSLLRRQREGKTACPICHSKHQDTLRQRTEFAAVKAAAQTLGLEVTSTEADYINQKSKLTIRCDRCETCTARPIAASKLKAGQGCRKLGLAKQAQKHRLDVTAVQAAVAAHPDQLTLISRADEYVNNRSALRLRCAAGHEFSSTLLNLTRKDRIRGCPKCGLPYGQALCSALLGQLLNATPSIEASPPALVAASPNPRYPLRFDAWFPEVVIAGIPTAVALEFHGSQHSDAEHYFHQRAKGGVKAAAQRLADSEAIKRELCQREGIALVEIYQDKSEHYEPQAWLADIDRQLLAQFPTLALDHDYQARKSIEPVQMAAALVKGILLTNTRLIRLKHELASREIELLSPDVSGTRANCRCTRCEHTWDAQINNLQQGTGCPSCAQLKRANKRRLTEAEVIARAKTLGWKPRWQAGHYQNNRAKLDWACQHCGHQIQRDFDHLIQRKRRCQHCHTATR